MPVRHHPSAQVRADYVSANLGPGASLAVTTHLEFCSVCAIAVQAMDGFPTASGDQAASRRSSPGRRASPADERRIAEKLPAPLKAAPRDPWRRVRSQIQACRLQGVSGLGEAVWLVEAARGARLNLGAGDALWGAVVLDGEVHDGDQRFTAGDFLDLRARPLLTARAEPAVLMVLVTDDAWGRSRWRRLLDRLAPATR